MGLPACLPTLYIYAYMRISVLSAMYVHGFPVLCTEHVEILGCD